MAADRQSSGFYFCRLQNRKGYRRILRVSQKRSPETERVYGSSRPPKIRRGLRLSQTYELSIPRLAKHDLRNAK